jgi:REP element-mobilizing transposase RayT
MPRQAREKSRSGIYHIMLRGINRQILFEDEEDYQKFIATLKEYKEISGYKIFAYCLMNNHVHLLLRKEQEELDLIMKRIAGSYVYWYNWKYKRKGHLFQDRFKSEPVEDNRYFLTVLRYIHQNPVKACLCKNCGKYKYSSYNEYVNVAEFVDTELCFDLIEKEYFAEYNNAYNEDVCLELEAEEFRLTDAEAQQIIRRISKCENATEFQCLSVEKRNEFLLKLRNEGLSIRQISRLTGVSFNVVRKF